MVKTARSVGKFSTSLPGSPRKYSLIPIGIGTHFRPRQILSVGHIEDLQGRGDR